MFRVSTLTEAGQQLTAELASLGLRDFHQHPDRLNLLRSQRVDARGLLVRNDDVPACFGLLERGDDGWYLWRGPEGTPNPAKLAALLAACPEGEQVTLVLRPDWVHLPTLTAAGWRLRDHWSTQHVRLSTADEGALLAALRSNARSRVRRARRAGLRFAIGREYLPEYFDVYARVMRESGSPDFADLELLDAHLDSPYAHLMVALDEDRRIAAGTVALVHADGIEARYVATNPEHRSQGPLHLVYLEAMRWAAEQSLHQFDLSGLATGLLDVKVAGINRFKLSFGGSPFTYPIFVRA